MTEAVSESGGSLPKHIQETVNELLGLVDPEKIYALERLINVRSPMLADKIGKDKVIGIELHRMLQYLLDTPPHIDPERQEYVLEGLVSCTTNAARFKELFGSLKTYCLLIRKRKDDTQALGEYLSDKLNSKIDVATDYILSPAASDFEFLGRDASSIDGIKSNACDAAASIMANMEKNGTLTEETRRAIEETRDFIQTWLDRYQAENAAS